MRLLFLTNFYPPHHIGGYEELCAEVAAGLRQRGHQVAVLTSNHGVGEMEGAARTVSDGWRGGWPEDGPVYRLLHPEVDLRPFRATVGYLHGRNARRQRNLGTLDRVLVSVAPQIVVIWGMWNLARDLAARAEANARSSVVYYLADYWPSLPDAYTLFWQEPARRWLTRAPKAVLARLTRRWPAGHSPLPALRFEHVLCVSQAVRDRLVQNGVPIAHARVVYNGIDLPSFAAAGNSPRPVKGYDGGDGSDDQALRVLYAGRLAPEKGVHTAIEALALAAHAGCPATLTIAGAGGAGYTQTLRRLSRRLGVAERVIFLGRVPREQLGQVLTEADVLVVPSTWPEPLPRVAQEGMAAGMVVVGSRVGGLPEIIEHDQNGLLFAAGDAADLARQLSRLVDPALRGRLAAAGAQTVATRFTIQRMVAEVETYLEAILTSAHAATSAEPAETSRDFSAATA